MYPCPPNQADRSKFFNLPLDSPCIFMMYYTPCLNTPKKQASKRPPYQLEFKLQTGMSSLNWWTR